MSKKDNSSFEEQKAQESKEAKKKLKAAEKQAPGGKEKGKDEKTGKKSKKHAARKWLKDFRGETKKIIWPDFKTVMKNTGIVLVTVLIIGVLVWVVDFILTQSIKGLKTVANGLPVSETTTVDFGDYTSALEEETTLPAEGGEETTQPAETTAETTPAPTAAPTTVVTAAPTAAPTTEPATEIDATTLEQ